MVGWWQLGVGLSWAGVVIAFLNLLPLWPLDGGHVLHSLIGMVMPARAALRAVLVWTLVAIGLLLVLGLIAKGADSGYLADERQRPNDAARRLLDPSLSAALWAQVRALPAYLLSLPWFLLFFTGLATLQDAELVEPTRDRRLGGVGEDRLAEAAAAERRGWHEASVPAMPKGVHRVTLAAGAPCAAWGRRRRCASRAGAGDGAGPAVGPARCAGPGGARHHSSSS